ncbi:CUE domain-containing protein 1 [Aphis craccivora]|uniref:CUE domain-containing protein 1 n=1 Tax=Aphis craccivora TaxID=307492 RepID=A0A6G0Y4E5_APHCR|nr:CUE domain-containing protein 1 [Aphis craccivora]
MLSAFSLLQNSKISRSEKNPSYTTDIVMSSLSIAINIFEPTNGFDLVMILYSPIEEQRFFIPNNTPGDDDAAFKERLKNMGKASRKKFIQIARVFTGKKKKSTARNILNQGDTHTKDNLFLHEEEH